VHEAKCTGALARGDNFLQKKLLAAAAPGSAPSVERQGCGKRALEELANLFYIFFV
jgi:hypothetical protein